MTEPHPGFQVTVLVRKCSHFTSDDGCPYYGPVQTWDKWSSVYYGCNHPSLLRSVPIPSDRQGEFPTWCPFIQSTT